MERNTCRRSYISLHLRLVHCMDTWPKYTESGETRSFSASRPWQRIFLAFSGPTKSMSALIVVQSSFLCLSDDHKVQEQDFLWKIEITIANNALNSPSQLVGSALHFSVVHWMLEKTHRSSSESPDMQATSPEPHASFCQGSVLFFHLSHKKGPRWCVYWHGFFPFIHDCFPHPFPHRSWNL